MFLTRDEDHGSEVVTDADRDENGQLRFYAGGTEHFFMRIDGVDHAANRRPFPIA